MTDNFVTMVEEALSFMATEKPEQALEVARRAETFAHDPDDDLQTLSAWNDLGTVFFRQGFTESADRIYAIAAAGKAYTGNLELQARLHNNRGQAYHRLGRLVEACAELTEAVKIRERTHPESRSLAIALDNLGAVEHSRGRLEESCHLHQHAIALFTQLDGYFSTDVATAVGNLGGLHSERRDFDTAEACRLRALYTHLRASGSLSSETLLNAQELCSLYLKLGRTEDIDWLVEFLLSTGKREPKASYRFLAEMLDTLARNAFAQHRLDLTDRFATRAVELLVASEGKESAATLKARFQRACTQRALTNLDDAEAEFTELLGIYGRLDEKINTVRTMIELAKTYRDKGGNRAARKLLESVVQVLDSQDLEDRELLSSALGNLAELTHAENDNDNAREHYMAALEALKDKSHLDWPWLTHGLANVEYHLGNHSTAVQLYASARQRWISLHGNKHPFVATCTANLALVHWSSGRTTDALNAFEEAMSGREEELLRQLTLGSDRQRRAYARAQQDDLSKIISFCLSQPMPDDRLATFAAEAMLNRKARVLDGIVHTLQLARTSGDSAVHELLARFNVVQAEMTQLGGPFRPRPTAAEIAKLRTLREEWERLEISLSHEGALIKTSLRNTTLESVQAAIPASAILIEYVRYKRFEPDRDGQSPWRGLHYAAVVIASSQPPAWFDLGSENDIDAQVNRLREVIALDEPVEIVHIESLELVERLLEPLAEQLAGKSHWLVAPDGLLNLLPFDVLLEAQDGIEHAPLLSYLVTGRHLGHATEAHASAGTTIIAAPDFDAVHATASTPETAVIQNAEVTSKPAQLPSAFGESTYYDDLPGTLVEALGVQQLLPSVRLISGPVATAEAMTTLQAPRILHIATHGVFEPLDEPESSWTTDLVPMANSVAFISRPIREPVDPMMYSGLVFAGANVQQNEEAKGIVTAREIAALDLNGTELVVLSACDTGVGHIRDGEEFSGLRRAFDIAGARAQLTSLWAVDDAATAAFMVAFYERVKAGKDRVVALREAQRHLRCSHSHPEWSHPYYWAAFGLSGSWGSMTV